ncbi:MAG: FimV/HubP family polar landmark protein, partial [Gammaproteobacteria bacterium]|nr:FimV/HubP family polar landmark protein [Gammaproteobacteria bacterium]
ALAAGDDADSGAVDLGVEESGEERLATVESETFQAMQDSDAQGAAIDEPTEDIGTESAADAEESYEDLPPVLPGDPLADQAGADQSGTEQPVDAAGDMDSDAAGDTMDDTVAGDSLAETDSTDMGAADGVTADTEAADEEEAPTPVVRRRPEPSMVDKALGFVTSPIGLGAIGGLLVMVILVAFMIRKRRSDAAAQTSAEMTGWDLDDEGDDDVTVVAGSADDTEATSGDDEMGAMFGSDEHRDEDTGTQRLEDDEAATQMLSEAEETQAMTSGAGSDDGGQDYTETVVGSDTQMLDENDPMSEADFHMAYGLYDQAADVIDKAIAANPSSKELKVKLAEIHFAANNADGFIAAATALKDQVGTGDSEWSNIAIMGKQIAGDNPLFADGGTGGGAVDLDFEAAGGEVSGDSGSDADVGVETEHASFDLPSEEPSADTSADSGSDEIDFDMDFGAGDDSDSDESAPAPVSDASSDDDDGALDFDLNLGEGDDSGADDEPLVDLSADSGDDDGLGDFGDFGGDLDSDLDSDLGGDLGGDLDAGDDASSDSGSDDDTQSEFDKALEELSAYVDTNQPDGGSESSAEEAGGDLNLDEFDFDSSASDSADDSGSDDDDDEGGLGEIGTKLDLAQAYIEMGDPDGARSILEEVLAEGDDEQKATAQSLIDSL